MKKTVCLCLIFCFVFSLMPSVSASAEMVFYFKASDFANHLGSWTLTDSNQDASGAGFLPFLKSPKPGTAQSAKCAFDLPESGDYYIYAFTRDYATNPGARWFTIAVNGQASDRKYGTHGTDGWAWECGSPVALEKGVNVVEIIDSGRNYGRVMSVVVTKDADFKGASTKQDMEVAYESYGVKLLELTEETTEAEIEETPYDVTKDSAIYISGADFSKHLGSWELETDEKDAGGFMPYLKSPKPAESQSAMVSFEVEKAGVYHIYAFTRDYTANQGSRRFGISVNGTALDRTFGTHGTDGWAWEYGGAVTLSEGVSTIEAVDTGRNYGRLMAIAVSPVQDFNGPKNLAEFTTALQLHAAKISETVVLPTPQPEEIVPEPETKPTYIPDNVPVQNDRPRDEIAIQLNGKYLVFQADSKPFVENDRTLVPFRALFEAMGCTVDWNDAMQTASGSRENIKISLPVGNNLATVSGENVYLDQPAVLRNDRVMVPIRFVAESLGATVSWDDAAQTVIIYADIPKINSEQSYLFLPESYSKLGAWTVSSSGNGSFETGTLTGGSQENPGNAPSATAYFDVPEAGEYKVWVHSRDYATNQPGTRFFNVAVNGVRLAETFGTHGKEGFYWTDGGNVHLNAGTNLLELLDTSDFFARCDAVLITKNLATDTPANTLDALQKNAKTVEKRVLSNDLSFPEYATQDGEILSEAYIENEFLRVDFYTVHTAEGVVVQNKITAKNSGTVTKEKNEEFGMALLSADRATLEEPLLGRQIFNTAYTDFHGNLKKYYGANIYNAANVNWLIPTGVTVSENKAYLTFTSDLADVKAVWSLEGNMSVLQVTAVPTEQGFYSLGVFEGNELCAEDILNADEIVPDPGVLTVGQQGVYVKNGVQKGIMTDYNAGICMRGPTGNFRATAFYPILGTPDSFKNSGETITATVKIISDKL